MIQPYYSDESVSLYLGDCREVLPALGQRFSAAIADPPYKATPLSWDHWPDGWLASVAAVTNSMWCFGNLRMFGTRWPEYVAAGWKLSHDAVGEFEVDTTVWEKHNGSGFTTDRLRGVHELVAHWYRGHWADVYHTVPRLPAEFDAKGSTLIRRPEAHGRHLGRLNAGVYVNDGLRLLRSVIRCKSTQRRAIHPTQKPVDLLLPLIEYAVPPGGTMVDPMAGSCSTGISARRLGIRSVLIEGDEAMCEKAATRLANDQDALPGLLDGEAS